MGLLDRIAARRCRVVGCEREAAQDTVVCRDHLTAMWRNQLTRREDGALVPVRTWTAKELAR